MTLDQWMDSTPGMRQLNCDIFCHIENTIHPIQDQEDWEVWSGECLRLIMTSVRQKWEEK